MDNTTFTVTYFVVGAGSLVRKTESIQGTDAEKIFSVTKDHNVELTQTEATITRTFPTDVLSSHPSRTTWKEVFGKAKGDTHSERKNFMAAVYNKADEYTKICCFAKDFGSSLQGFCGFQIED